MCSDENRITSGAILSFEVVCTGSGILRSVRDHRKSLGRQGRLPTSADMLVNILIPNSVMGID